VPSVLRARPRRECRPGHLHKQAVSVSGPYGPPADRVTPSHAGYTRRSVHAALCPVLAHAFGDGFPCGGGQGGAGAALRGLVMPSGAAMGRRVALLPPRVLGGLARGVGALLGLLRVLLGVLDAVAVRVGVLLCDGLRDSRGDGLTGLCGDDRAIQDRQRGEHPIDLHRSAECGVLAEIGGCFDCGGCGCALAHCLTSDLFQDVTGFVAQACAERARFGIAVCLTCAAFQYPHLFGFVDAARLRVMPTSPAFLAALRGFGGLELCGRRRGHEVVMSLAKVPMPVKRDDLALDTAGGLEPERDRTVNEVRRTDPDDRALGVCLPFESVRHRTFGRVQGVTLLHVDCFHVNVNRAITVEAFRDLREQATNRTRQPRDG
jgi:hypothetical protein